MSRLRSAALGRPPRRPGVRIKLDEGLSHLAETALRTAGHDVDTVHDEDLAGAGDDRLFNAARSDGRALVTLDVDFANPTRFPPDRQRAHRAATRQPPDGNRPESIPRALGGAPP
jgi:hypothetical protein